MAMWPTQASGVLPTPTGPRTIAPWGPSRKRTLASSFHSIKGTSNWVATFVAQGADVVMGWGRPGAMKGGALWTL